MHNTAHLKFDIEQFPPTPRCIKHHISHTYLQCSMWHQSPFIEKTKMNPVKYGYKFDGGENLLPTITTELSISVGLSIPCNYSKCSRLGVCRCRQRQTVCCHYWKWCKVWKSMISRQLQHWFLFKIWTCHLSINNLLTLYLQYQNTKLVKMTVHKSPNTAPRGKE